MTNLEAYERYSSIKFIRDELLSFLLIDMKIYLTGGGGFGVNGFGLVKKFCKEHTIDSIDNGNGKETIKLLMETYINELEAHKGKYDTLKEIDVDKYLDWWLNSETMVECDYAEKAIEDKDESNVIDI